jgi:hypothetical protein
MDSRVRGNDGYKATIDADRTKKTLPAGAGSVFVAAFEAEAITPSGG